MTNPDFSQNPSWREGAWVPEYMGKKTFADLMPGELMYASADSFKIREGTVQRVIVDTVDAVYGAPINGPMVAVVRVFEWRGDDLIDDIIADFTRVPYLNKRSSEEADAHAEKWGTKGILAAMFRRPDGGPDYVGPQEFYNYTVRLVTAADNVRLGIPNNKANVIPY